MTHPTAARLVLVVLVTAVLAVLAVPAGPTTPAAVAASSRPARLAGPAAEPAAAGPGAHFGFSQASVLAQVTATQTVIALQATQQAAPTPTLSGTPGAAGACVGSIGGTCNVSGAVSGSWTKSGSGSYSFQVNIPANAVLNDGPPLLFLPTTAGVEQRTCSAPTSFSFSVSCSGSTVGDLLLGATVTVRFVATIGFQDVTGVVRGPGGNPTIQKTVTAINGFPVFSSGVPDVRPGDRVTFRVTVGNTQGTVTFRDFLSPNLTFGGAVGALCVPIATPATRPPGVAPNATTVECTLVVSDFFGASVSLDATVNANVTAGPDGNANVACLRTDPSGTLGACGGVSLNIITPTATPTPGLRKVAIAVNGVSLPAPSNVVDLAPGSRVTFQLTGSNVPASPFTAAVAITDFLSPRFAVNLSDVSGADCVIVPTPPDRPAGVAGDATTIDCVAAVPSSGSVTINVVATLRADAPQGLDAAANVACFGSVAAGPPALNRFTGCTTVQARIGGPTPTPAGPTIQQALAQVPPSGLPGVPCAGAPGAACTVEGSVSGQGVVVASMRWTLTVTVPAGVAPGTAPVAVFTTTAGAEGFACSPVVAGAATVTCTGTTAGNALQGSTVTVVFGTGLTATGRVALGAGGAPPVPVAPLLPPHPPALAPPPPLVPIALVPPSRGAPGGYPEVPVVPEADSVALLGIGLAAVAALVCWRRRGRGAG